MNEKRYSALHFQGPGTNLRVGLADDHLWMGGGTQAGTGAYCIPNMPTEEVFTTPHKDERGRNGHEHQAAVLSRHDD